MTTYTDESISAEYHNLPCRLRAQVLYDALDFMQQHNGRSKWDCIILAMGYVHYDKDDTLYIKRGEA